MPLNPPCTCLPTRSCFLSWTPPACHSPPWRAAEVLPKVPCRPSCRYLQPPWRSLHQAASSYGKPRLLAALLPPLSVLVSLLGAVGGLVRLLTSMHALFLIAIAAESRLHHEAGPPHPALLGSARGRRCPARLGPEAESAWMQQPTGVLRLPR